jgi:hypothetical protein
LNPYEIAAFSILGLGILLSWLSFRYQLGLLCECIEGLAAEHDEQHETLRIGLLNTDSFARGEAKRASDSLEGHALTLRTQASNNHAWAEGAMAGLTARVQEAAATLNECSDSLEGHALTLRTQAQAHADRTEASAITGRLPRSSPGRIA